MKQFLWLIMVLFLVLNFALQLQPVHTAMAQSPLETPPTPLMTGIVISDIEPSALNSFSGGTLSIYGTGFTTGCVARLVNYGLLNTTYINPTSLIAQVPPNIPAGTYPLEISDGISVMRYEKALTVVAPTPTPSPTSAPQPPPPGRPILTIKNFKIEPERVQAGQEFLVSIEIYNNGSRAAENTMAVFAGTSFMPVGEAGHLLWQLHINHTVIVTQKMRAPQSMSTGVHQLHVNLSANDWEGTHYEYPQTIPVEVIGQAPITGKPRVTIETATTTPQHIIPGEAFTLTLQLANRGSRTAVNVFASCVSETVLPKVGSDVVSTPKIAIDETIQLHIPLVLDLSSKGGFLKLEMTFDYEDYDGAVYASQETIGVDVNASLSMLPQVLIRDYHTLPQFVQPGDIFTLTVNVANVGGQDAQRLILALGGENGSALDPFSPMQSGNVSYLEYLEAGSVAAIHWSLIADGASQAKAYNLPLAMAYDDARGVRHNEIQRLSLIVRHRPELQAMFYRDPEDLSVGAPTLVSLEILNVGSGVVHTTGMTAKGANLDIQEEGTPFLGPIDPGGSAPLDITITPRESGSAEIVVLVRYRDDFNQSQQITVTLPISIESDVGSDINLPISGEMSDNAFDPDTNNQTLWQRIRQILKGFIGLGS